MYATLVWILWGGCRIASQDTDSGEEPDSDTAEEGAVPFRALGSGEIYGGFGPETSGRSCEEEVATALLRDQASLDAWVGANLPERALDAAADWSSEIVLAATLDCVNGNHPMHLDALVQDELALRADYVLTYGCFDTSGETREYAVVAVPATIPGDPEATWSLFEEGC